MYNGKTFLAVIPARGGSKRLPKKNILPLLDKPLIAWTIEAAKKSKYLDRVIVSTEDKEIVEVSQNYGAEVIIRPEHLATDEAKTVDVVIDLIDKISVSYDYIVLLQPTSPLRNENHIDDAIELLFNKKADGIISVCEADHPPLWMNTLPEDGSMKNFLKEEVKNTRSQDLPKYFRINGAIYIKKTSIFKINRNFFNGNSYAYIMDKVYSVDIDREFDFLLTKCILKDILEENK